MEPFLSPAGRAALSVLVARRALAVLDFDGTLAPEVPCPAAAALRPETRRLLRIAALLHPVAVVSGRRRADVAARLEGVPLVAVIGAQGGEPGFGPLDAAARAQTALWIAHLSRALAGAPGIALEGKGVLLAVHHAGVAAGPARRRIADAVRGLDGARLSFGRDVIHVRPAGGPDKRSAVAALLRRERCDVALYVGDDWSDEAAFALPGVVGVRIGAPRRSRARFHLPAQDAVDALLHELVRARLDADGRAGRVEALARALDVPWAADPSGTTRSGPSASGAAG